MIDFAPLCNRLSVLRRQTLIMLAEQPEDGAFDAGLLALLANVQNALAAVEEIVEVERPPANQASEVSPSSGANAPTTP